MQSVFFQRGAFVSEPAILVKRMNMGSQVWSMEKLENKLVDMREMYEDRKDPNNCQRLPAIKVRCLIRCPAFPGHCSPAGYLIQD